MEIYHKLSNRDIFKFQCSCKDGLYRKEGIGDNGNRLLFTSVIYDCLLHLRRLSKRLKSLTGQECMVGFMRVSGILQRRFLIFLVGCVVVQRVSSDVFDIVLLMILVYFKISEMGMEEKFI